MVLEQHDRVERWQLWKRAKLGFSVKLIPALWSEISVFTSIFSPVDYEWWTFFKISLWKLIYETVFYKLLDLIKIQDLNSCIGIRIPMHSYKNINLILLHHPNKACILKTFIKVSQGKQMRISAYNKFFGKGNCGIAVIWLHFII